MANGNAKADVFILDMCIADDNFEFASSIDSALHQANMEIQTINESIESVKSLKPDCDKLDYALSACSGALCGIIDIFLVGKPGESPIGDLTDKWFANRIIGFAKILGWEKNDDSKLDILHQCIAFLEDKFKVPYDESVGRGIFKELLHLTPSNHHFKSLAHNPTLLGLFFSILNQFTNTSSFVSNGELITLTNSDGNFELEGKNIPAKLFCGFVNWIGHLISDVSGSKTSKGRGMGIPSPLWTWMNDVIAIKSKLHIPVTEFDKKYNDLAEKLFTEGFDFRFQTAQTIPVLINELLVRLLYAVRRMIRFFSENPKGSRSFALLWQSCEPFKNPTVKRMLTVAHGTFCIVDAGDAVIRAFISGGGSFNPVEFFLRLNVAGLGRFAISLYGEGKRAIEFKQAEKKVDFAFREKTIVENYIDGLNILSELYDDKSLLTFIDEFKNSSLYVSAFNKSVELAIKRNVPDERILKSKKDIDSYFGGN